MTDMELAYRKAEIDKKFEEAYSLQIGKFTVYPAYAERMMHKLLFDLTKDGMTREVAWKVIQT